MEEPPDERHPAVRISDDDRNRAVDVLRRHCTEGRLTLDEFSERVSLVFDARTDADISRVMADLPSAAVAVPEQGRRPAKGWTVAILGGSTRRGRWRPRPHTWAVAVMGGCELDLRQAEIDGSEIEITAVAVMGGIDIVVPEGIEVDLSGVPIMGGKDLRVKDVPLTPGAPRVKVRAFPVMGGVTVRSKGPKSGRRGLGAGDGGAPDVALDAGYQREHDHMGRRGERRRRRVERRYGPGASAAPAPADALEPHPPNEPDPLHSVNEVGVAEPTGDDTYGSPGVAPPAAPTMPPSPEDLGTPGASRMPTAPDGTVTILFSDIAGYTPMTERLGDLRAGELLATHNKIVRNEVASHGGFEVKSQGDGFMVAFAGASRALRCAVAIQKAFAEHNSTRPDEPIQIHLGLHTGEVVRQGDDFLGRTVIMASRITAQAHAGEILVSGLIHELAGSSGEFRFGDPREAELKGISAPQLLYPVVWSC